MRICGIFLLLALATPLAAAPSITGFGQLPAAGGPACTAGVTGSGFVPGAVVYWNETPLATKFNFPESLEVAIPAALIALPAVVNLTVRQGGEISPPYVIVIADPAVPLISSLSPATAAAAGPAFTLSVNGAWFAVGDSVFWNGVQLNSWPLTSFQMNAEVPAELIAAPGTANVTVRNTKLIFSNPLPFTITARPPVSGPAIYSLIPAWTPAGGAPFTLTVTGAGFLSGAAVKWNGVPLPTTYGSATQLTAAVAASQTVTRGEVKVAVTNPGGATSPEFGFTVSGPPEIEWVSLALAGEPTYYGAVDGTRFAPGAVAYWNGTALTTFYANSTRLLITAPAEFVAKPGTAMITVRLNGVASAPYELVIISPNPAIRSLSPSTVVAGAGDVTLTLDGTGFDKYSYVLWNGECCLNATFVNSAHLTASVSFYTITEPLTAQISVANRNPKTNWWDLKSNAVPFVVTGPDPVISSLSPASALAGGYPFMMTIYGTGFLPRSVAQWNGEDLPSNWMRGTEMLVAVQANRIAQPGTASVRVINPGGKTSPAVTFAIRSPNPVLTSLSPTVVAAGTAGFTLTVNGSNFRPGAVVQWNGNALPTTLVNATQLTAFVPPALFTTPGSYRVTVTNLGGFPTDALPVTVNPPPPLITGLNPASTVAGAAAFTLAVTGSGFTSSATVRWNGAPLPTTFQGATQLAAAVPASQVATAGMALVTVANGVIVSLPKNFTINSSPPVVTRLTPESALAGSTALELAVAGNYFQRGAVVRWGGANLTTSFDTVSQLRAQLPAALLSAAGTYSVTVRNPDGMVSTARAFTVNPAQPAIAVEAVLNAASGQALIAPGSLISIYGSNLAGEKSSAGGVPLPTTLNGTTVKINGIAIPLLYVSPSQVNAQVPFAVLAGTASLAVWRNDASSLEMKFEVKPAAPGVFMRTGASHALAVNAAGASLNSAENPVRPGEYLVLYVTGQGQLDNPVNTGAPAPLSPFSFPLAAVEARIGGKPAQISFAGLAPGWVGLLQVNVVVPAVPAGEQPLEITIGGIAGNLTAVSVASN